MSSSEASVLSSVPSSPVSNASSLTSSPISSPLSKRRRIYGREYREDSSDDGSEEEMNLNDTNHGSGQQDDMSDEVSFNHDINCDDIQLSSSGLSSSYASSVHSGSSILDIDNTGGSDSDRVSSDSSRPGSELDSESDEDDFKQKLYSGSVKTTDEAVLALMELYIRRRWDETTLKDILSFCKEFFPSNMPGSLFKLYKYIENLTPTNYSEVKHYYCSKCLSSKMCVQDQCESCECADTSVFFELPLSTQIQHFFEHRNLASFIDNFNAADRGGPDTIFDICSGSKYKKLKETVNGMYDITLAFNSDGVPLVHSSKAHLYPILATVCEVLPQFRSGFMVVCGIWYDPRSPPIMNDYFALFTNSLKELSVKGVSWTHPVTKEDMTSVVVAPLLIADALARADIIRIQRCNSKYACNSCEQKSIRVNSEVPSQPRKLRRFVFQEEPARLRSDSRMEKQGEKATRTGNAVKGVTGHAVVSQIPHFERSTSAVPEYMHLVLLGVVKQLINLWFFTPGEWNIKHKMEDIDEFIQNSVKVTDEFSRIPKGLKDFKNWKANDLRTWLLFVSLPALSGVLPDKYFQHYMFLVSAIFTLLKEGISQNEVNNAEAKLRLFIRDVGLLYRQRDYVYNMHMLLHLPQYVRSWGPLWATSAFPFESFNHVLGELAHGTKHKGTEIVKRIRLGHGVQILRSKVGHAALRTTKDDVLGCPVDITFDFDLPHGTDTYVRVSFNGEIFTCKSYDEKKKRANSYVQFTTLEGSTGYGQIVCFYLRDATICSLSKTFEVQHTKIFFIVMVNLKSYI